MSNWVEQLSRGRVFQLGKIRIKEWSEPSNNHPTTIQQPSNNHPTTIQQPFSLPFRKGCC